MRARTITMAAPFALAFALPAPAYAATAGSAPIVPEWLSIAAGGVGLIIAVLLMVDAVLLRRVAEGSIVADNIAYMMSGVVCFAVSMLARWVAIFTSDVNLVAQVSWAADLLVTAGMALLTVYFMRVRLALTRYLKAVAAAYPGLDESPGPETDAQEGQPLG